jgi:hypothetical protein
MGLDVMDYVRCFNAPNKHHHLPEDVVRFLARLCADEEHLTLRYNNLEELTQDFQAERSEASGKKVFEHADLGIIDRIVVNDGFYHVRFYGTPESHRQQEQEVLELVTSAYAQLSPADTVRGFIRDKYIWVREQQRLGTKYISTVSADEMVKKCLALPNSAFDFIYS